MDQDEFNVYYDGKVYSDIPTDITAFQLEQIMQKRLQRNDSKKQNTSITERQQKQKQQQQQRQMQQEELQQQRLKLFKEGSSSIVGVTSSTFQTTPRYSNYFMTRTPHQAAYVEPSPHYDHDPYDRVKKENSMPYLSKKLKHGFISSGTQCNIEKELKAYLTSKLLMDRKYLGSFGERVSKATQTVEKGDGYYYDRLVPCKDYNEQGKIVKRIPSENQDYYLVRDENEMQRIRKKYMGKK